MKVRTCPFKTVLTRSVTVSYFYFGLGFISTIRCALTQKENIHDGKNAFFNDIIIVVLTHEPSNTCLIQDHRVTTGF